jgi:hypothetical protein
MKTMKKNAFILQVAVMLVFISGCSKERTNSDEFLITIDGSLAYDLNDIDFYDFSSHLVYLKEGTTFIYDKAGTFKVMVKGSEIYSGTILTWFSSMLPAGPHIFCMPSIYGNYIIPIRFRMLPGADENIPYDPRGDQRIMDILQKHGKFRNGLSSEIVTLQFNTLQKIELTLKITNNDDSDILYLDPDKMGNELFHYFTNGLTLYSRFKPEISFTHQLEALPAEPYDSWQKEWLSVLSSNESKTIVITYDNFESVEPGQYRAVFNYPGLRYQVNRDELFQPEGRIWLGEVDTEKLFFILE